MSPVAMPFGKHRGVPLSELPSGYLDWLNAKLNEWREPFRSALAAELARRKGPNAPIASTLRSTQRGSARLASNVSMPTVCDICGLPGTTQRPLVDGNCVRDEEVRF